MMNQAQLAAASLDDIVFDGRNKAYGAYELRHIYDRHLQRALIIASLLFALLISFPIVSQLLRDPLVAVRHREVLIEPEDVVMPPIEPPVVTPPVQPATQQVARPATTATTPPTAAIRFVPPTVSATAPTTDVPDVDDLDGKRIGTQTVAGPAISTTADPDAPGLAGPAVMPGVAAPAALYTYVEQMPELPGGGGMLAIVAAIQKAVRYPPLALRNGVEGRLYASFVVNAEGEITNIKIVKGLGSGLDEETIRAIQTLPRFIPGKQNGRAVSVAFTVPLSYKIQ